MKKLRNREKLVIAWLREFRLLTGLLFYTELYFYKYIRVYTVDNYDSKALEFDKLRYYVRVTSSTSVAYI